MNRPTIMVAIAVSVAALAGCGQDKAKSTSQTDAMLDRLPANLDDITAADLSAVKRKLGVAASLDPTRHGVDDPKPVVRVHDVAGVPLSYIDNLTPVTASIDYRRVTAAVSAGAPRGDEILIIATPQPAAEIERGLRRAGRTAVGADAYALKPGDVSGDLDDLDTIAFGHGLVVLATSADVARGVLQRAKPEPRLAATRALLDAVPGDLRAVTVGTPISDRGQCIRAVAGGARFDGGDEQLVMRLAEVPTPRRVVLDEGINDEDILSADYDVRKVTTDGHTIRIGLHIKPGAVGGSSAAAIAMDEVPAERVYRCSGDPAPAPAEKATDANTPAGTDLEKSIAVYLAAASETPNLIRVHCPAGAARADRVVHCTGTRPDPRTGTVYHYTLVAQFTPGGHFESIDINSKDDKDV